MTEKGRKDNENVLLYALITRIAAQRWHDIYNSRCHKCNVSWKSQKYVT